MTDWGLGSYERTAAQLAAAAERAVDAAEVGPGERVLDVGCGTGNAALLAAMRGAAVTGVDLSARLLDVAAGRAAAAGIEGTWRTGDATALPVPDGAFDATLSVFGVIFARPPEEAVAELVRVTAPDGRIVLTTWTSDGPVAAGSAVLRSAMAEAAAEAATAGRDATAGEGAVSADQGRASADAGRVPGPDPRDWGDPEHLRALFAPHGIVPEVDPFGHVFTADSPAAFADEWLDLHPMWLAARPVLGDAAYAALREPLIAALEAGNEDPAAFRATSTAMLVRADLG
jgi:SAM-dependent methyltransferase